MKRIVFLFVFSLLYALPIISQVNSNQLPVLMINELEISDQTSDDIYIELLVINKNGIPFDNDQYSNIILDDSNKTSPSTPSSAIKPGHIAISEEVLTDVKNGDLIVIYGSGTNIVGLPEGVISLSVDNASIEKFSDFPNVNNSEYLKDAPRFGSANITDFISFEGNGDEFKVRIGENYSNVIKLINGQNNYSLASMDLKTYEDLAPTVGIPNTLDNEDFINNLKSSNEFYTECGQLEGNRGYVKIYNEEGPFDITHDSYEITKFEYDYLELNDLLCGINSVVVSIKGEVIKSVECVFTVSLQENFELTLCNEDKFQFLINSCLRPNSSDCYAYSINGGEPISLQFEELSDDIQINGNSEIVLFVSDGNGRLIQKITYLISQINFSDSCDDGDDCTINDSIDEFCNCLGEAPVDIGLITNPFEVNCEVNELTIETIDNFESYEWYYRLPNSNSTIFLSNDKKVIASKPGRYIAYLINSSGCKYEAHYDYFSPRGQGVNDFIIEASKREICEGERITLRVPSYLESPVWFYNTDDLEQISEGHLVTVSSTGEYICKFSINGCDYDARYEVFSPYSEIKILPENPIVCSPDFEVSLSLEGLPEVDYQILWSNNSNTISTKFYNENEASVLVQIGDLDPCKVSIRKDFISDNNEDVSNILESNGFYKSKIEIIALPAIKNDSGIEQKSACGELDHSNVGDVSYEIKFLEGENEGVTILLNDFLIAFMADKCLCNSYSGILVDHFCGSQLSIDEFLKSNSSLKVYIPKDEATIGEQTEIWFSERDLNYGF